MFNATIKKLMILVLLPNLVFVGQSKAGSLKKLQNKIRRANRAAQAKEELKQAVEAAHARQLVDAMQTLRDQANQTPIGRTNSIQIFLFQPNPTFTLQEQIREARDYDPLIAGLVKTLSEAIDREEAREKEIKAQRQAAMGPSWEDKYFAALDEEAEALFNALIKPAHSKSLTAI